MKIEESIMSSSSNPNALNDRIFSLLSNIFPLFTKRTEHAVQLVSNIS
jgi:hypothetical protein